MSRRPSRPHPPNRDEPSVVSPPSASSPVATKRVPYRAVSPWRTATIAVLVAASIALRWWWGIDDSVEPATAPPIGEGTYVVERVVDGDTLLLADGVRVRLLGIDTPESALPDVPPEPWGSEAGERTKQLISSAGNRVRLTFDNEPFDRHGRRLAWVWNGDELLNETLVREGYSPAMTKFPYSPAKKDRLRAAEREAKNARRGIWSIKKP